VGESNTLQNLTLDRTGAPDFGNFRNAASPVDTGCRQGQIAGGMRLKTLREMRDTAPFKPFEIQLADGRALLVATPDHLFFMPNSSEFLVVLADGAFRIVDAGQVVNVGRGTARARTK
jgi:hypothetical protein